MSHPARGRGVPTPLLIVSTLLGLGLGVGLIALWLALPAMI